MLTSLSHSPDCSHAHFFDFATVFDLIFFIYINFSRITICNLEYGEDDSYMFNIRTESRYITVACLANKTKY